MRTINKGENKTSASQKLTANIVVTTPQAALGVIFVVDTNQHCIPCAFATVFIGH